MKVVSIGRVLGIAVAVALLVLALFTPRAARAQAPPASSTAPASSTSTSAVAPENAEQADALKKRGDEAMDALRYGDALTAYQRAYAITKNPALLYNQARAHQALGDFAAAASLLDRFASEASPELKSRVPQLQQLMDEMRARVARLTVRCNIAGAQVLLGDRVLGTTPLGSDMRITSGRATLRVTADGYQPYKRELDLPGGGAVGVDAELVSKDSSSLLVVRSNIENATVSIDGKASGQTPIELALLAGGHAVRVERKGYDTVETQVVLAVGDRKELDINLSQPPPIYAKWWFWAGVGAVVVGGVVTVYALTTERGPDSGSVTPGRLSAPLVRW